MPQTPQHPRPRPRYGSRRAPLAWRAWLVEVLGASPRLAQQLWHRFRMQASYDDLERVYGLSAHADRAGVLALFRLIPPQRLLDLCVQLWPEGTAERPRDIRHLEDAIVARARGPQAWR